MCAPFVASSLICYISGPSSTWDMLHNTAKNLQQESSEFIIPMLQDPKAQLHVNIFSTFTLVSRSHSAWHKLRTVTSPLLPWQALQVPISGKPFHGANLFMLPLLFLHLSNSKAQGDPIDMEIANSHSVCTEVTI